MHSIKFYITFITFKTHTNTIAIATAQINKLQTPHTFTAFHRMKTDPNNHKHPT